MNEIKITFQSVCQLIQEKQLNMAENYVAIGYYLRKAREAELYKDGGYASIHEMAAGEFGMARQTADHCMKINEKFSEGGDSPALEESFRKYGKSQLQEMLYLTDEQMLEHYIGLVKRYGRLTAKYRNAICYVQDEEHVYEAMEPDMESEKFWLTDVPHSSIRREGFPLDSISLDPGTGKYFYDLPETAVDQVAVEEGFLIFFRRILQYR